MTMLRFDVSKKEFTSLDQCAMKGENILERYDFQAAIVKSWERVKSFLGLPTAFLIGQEITPHHSVGDAIDLLAFDPEDSSLTVIELKRGKQKLQLLQAVSYASMVATWGKDQLIESIQRDINPDPEELIDLINGNELNKDIKIILVAESYDPEVILAADWLRSHYGVLLTVFSASCHKYGDEVIVNLEQRLPLKELQDLYEVRGSRSRSRTTGSDVTWEEVLPKLKYPFATRALELCRKEKEGEPSRRRFGSFRTSIHGYDWITVNFREKYLNIYMGGKPEDAETEIKQVFGASTEVSTWEGGYSFKVTSQEQFQALVKWLEMKE
jgi:hypothetical protein